MEDLEKKIEALERRIKELESKSNDNVAMFGRSYSQLGKSNSDLILKTRGQIKIQWGNKFFDLIKDGKINVNSTFIYEGEVGSKDGIYVTEEDVILKVGENEIKLTSENSSTYVSFLEEQDTSSENKYTALKNIGFIYSDPESVNDKSLKNGIIYVESTKKLYTIQNGGLSEYTMSIPNPYTEQFIIQKNNSDTGAILIKGSGIKNSLAFDSLYIFTEDNISYLNAQNALSIQLEGNTYVSVNSSKTTVKNNLECNSITSINGNQNYGFKLVLENGESTLYVDNVVERNSSVNNNQIYPTTWSAERNTITDYDYNPDSDENTYQLTLSLDSTYKVNDYLYLYTIQETETEDLIITGFEKTVLIIKEVVSSKQINVELVKGNLDSNCIGQVLFLIGSENGLQYIRYSENSIDLLECKTNIEEENTSSVQSRLGLLNDLNLKIKNSNSEIEVSGLGSYNKQGYFKEIAYTSDYELNPNDSSSRLASTEWVQNLSKAPLPIGSIIMFDGRSAIPDGWKICDGTDGTPNLIGKFIKASTASGITGGQNTIQLTTDHLPEHSHALQIDFQEGYGAKGDEPVIFWDNTSSAVYMELETETYGKGQPFNIEPEYYSLIFIMKV